VCSPTCNACLEREEHLQEPVEHILLFKELLALHPPLNLRRQVAALAE
jgi:hypothetical protein